MVLLLPASSLADWKVPWKEVPREAPAEESSKPPLKE